MLMQRIIRVGVGAALRPVMKKPPKASQATACHQSFPGRAETPYPPTRRVPEHPGRVAVVDRALAAHDHGVVRTRHYAPEANGVVERFNQSLKHEHLYQREIDHAATLAGEVDAFLLMLNEVRPHESLAWRQPLAVHREDPHLFRTSSLQHP